MTITEPEVTPQKTDLPVHTPGPVEQGLIDALALFGPNGERWYRGDLANQEETSFCAVGALVRAHDISIFEARVWEVEEWDSLEEISYLYESITKDRRNETSVSNGYPVQAVTAYNDNQLNFTSVRAIFEKAILAARRDGV
jgi:hypothetical protein